MYREGKYYFFLLSITFVGYFISVVRDRGRCNYKANYVRRNIASSYNVYT
jgi:hypothetical protein